MDEGDSFYMEPNDGMEYVIMYFRAKNVTNKDISVDLLSAGITYTASYKDMSADNTLTILMSDLGTYEGTIKAGSSKKLVLLFQFPKGKVKQPGNVTLTCTQGSETKSIKL